MKRAVASAVDPQVTAFLNRYCVECHGATKPKGDFQIGLLKVSTNQADAENWQLVLDNLQLGEMPPEEAKQPTPAEVEKDLALSWLLFSRPKPVAKPANPEAFGFKSKTGTLALVAGLVSYFLVGDESAKKSTSLLGLTALSELNISCMFINS